MPAKKTDHVAGFPLFDLEQTHVQTFLESCLRDRVPALLFTGPEGVGKEHTAVDFARRLCCEQDPKCPLDGPHCESCQKALHLEHSGIHLIYPAPTPGTGEKENDDEPDIGKVLEEKRHDFFAPYAFTKKVSVRIARARAIIQRANTKPFGSAYDVFIINDAHAMREEAQNALLKLVEEPPPHAVLILITPNPDAILYTIRSRCQRVRFAPLKPHVVTAILTRHYGISERKAAAAAELCQGGIRRALELAAEQDEDERRAAYDVLARIQEAPESWVIGSAVSCARSGNRDSVARFLHELAVAYRDVMAGDEALFINKDMASELNAQVGRWDPKRLPGVVDRIVETRDGVLARNLNTEAALVHLFLDIRHLGC